MIGSGLQMTKRTLPKSHNCYINNILQRGDDKTYIVTNSKNVEIMQYEIHEMHEFHRIH